MNSPRSSRTWTFKATLHITSKSVPAKTITNLTGLQPDVEWVMGQTGLQSDPGSPARLSPRPSRFHLWEKYAPAWHDKSLEEQVEGLLPFIRQAIGKLSTVQDELTIILRCGAMLRERHLSLTFSPPVVKDLALLGAEIGLDTYFDYFDEVVSTPRLLHSREQVPEQVHARLEVSSSTLGVDGIARLMGAASDPSGPLEKVWVRSRGPSDDIFLSHHTHSVLQIFQEETCFVNEIVRQCHVRLVCVGRSRAADPDVDTYRFGDGWEPDVVRELARVNAALDIEVHFFDDAESG